MTPQTDEQIGISGPWDNEPSTKDFESSGLACAMRRTGTGRHWCGYVGVPDTHPWYGKHYNDLYDEECCPDVHGGITFSGKAYPEDNVLWWFGFDCAHSFDVCPGFGRSEFDKTATYKTEHYVTRECELLAAQIAKVSTAQ